MPERTVTAREALQHAARAIDEYALVESELAPFMPDLIYRFVTAVAWIDIVHDVLRNVDLQISERGEGSVIYANWRKRLKDTNGIYYLNFVRKTRGDAVHRLKMPELDEGSIYIGAEYKRFSHDKFTEQTANIVGKQSAFVLRDLLEWWRTELEWIDAF